MSVLTLRPPMLYSEGKLTDALGPFIQCQLAGTVRTKGYVLASSTSTGSLLVKGQSSLTYIYVKRYEGMTDFDVL